MVTIARLPLDGVPLGVGGARAEPNTQLTSLLHMHVGVIPAKLGANPVKTMDHQRLGQACESASGQAAILQPDHGGRNAAGLRILAGRLRLILVPFKSGWVTENVGRLGTYRPSVPRKLLKRASQLHRPSVNLTLQRLILQRPANRRQAGPVSFGLGCQ